MKQQNPLKISLVVVSTPWTQRVSRNRKNYKIPECSRDFVVFPGSRHFPYSKDFVVSPVSSGLMLDQVPSELSAASVKRGVRSLPRSLPVKTVSSRQSIWGLHQNNAQICGKIIHSELRWLPWGASTYCVAQQSFKLLTMTLICLRCKLHLQRYCWESQLGMDITWKADVVTAKQVDACRFLKHVNLPAQPGDN